MSFSPETGASGTVSPYEFVPDICRNLDSQFLNETESIKESMCVYARVRPMLPHEEAKGFKECIAAVDEKTVRIVIPVTSAKYKNSRQSKETVQDYFFNSAFGPESGQFVFFQEAMLTSMQNFVDGRNSLVFSYGITGSGKTYTLQGNSENPGIIPLSLRLYFAAVKKQLLKEIKVKPHMYNKVIALSAAEQKQESCAKRELLSLYDKECDVAPGSFRNSNSNTFAMTLCNLFSDDYEAEERQTTLGPEDMASAQAATVMKEVIKNSAENQQGVCSVWVSFVEIYNENIFDLLQPFINERKRLMLREDNGNVYIEGAREICVSDGDEALKILNIGRKQLSIASTKMNYQSSRSHCIYTIRVVRIPDANNLSCGRVHRLSFCDLAGSERVAKAQTAGMRLKEAGAINTSLMVLGRCLVQLRLNQIGKDKKIIPFRDSKLTRLISGFFMGQGKVVMIANASPCDYTFDETLHVLKFTAIAKKLLVNDTFFSDATSTLQSICNQWSNISNSSINESMESVESDSDIIQKKDEIIEKLLDLAQNLAKKEQEMAGMEMKIRQNVYLEYSEYSDELLEEKRIMYEQMMGEMRERYEKRIEKLTNMYEDIIKELREELNATIYSNEDTVNDSKSIVDLEDSLTKSPVKGLKNTEELQESIQSQNTELEALQSTLASLTTELEQTRQKLLENQRSNKNLEIELSTYKAEKVKLSNECENYQNAESKAMKVAKKFEVDVKDLEEQISSLQKELNASKELCLMKEFNFHEMESENEVLKSNADVLKKEIKSLKADYDLDSQNLGAKINSLEDKLMCVEKDYAEAKEQLQRNEVLKNNADALKEITNLEAVNVDNHNLKVKINVLEEKLLYSKKNYTEVKEQLECTNKLKEENERLERKVKELKDSKAQYEECIANYKTDISNLEDRLLSINKDYDKAREELQNHCNQASELEKEIEVYKNEISLFKKHSSEAYKNAMDENKLKEQNHEQDISSLKNKLSKANEELENIFLHSEKFLSEIGTKIKPESNITKVLKNSEEFSYSRAYLSITEQLKDKILTLLQELQVSNKNADLITKEMKVREAVSVELEKEINVYKEEIETLKHRSENVELLEKLSLISQELEVTKDCYTRMSAKHSELESRNNSYETEIESLKQKQETKEMELTEKLSLSNKELKTLQGEIEQKSSLLLDSENQISVYKHDIKKMMKSQKTIEEEKQDLMMIISTNEEKIEDLEDELAAVNKELETVKDVMVKSSVVEDLQNCLEQHTVLVEILGKCEAKATEKIKKLHTITLELKSEVVDLHRQIRGKESSIEELEKALCESQEQLKDIQVSCNQKLLSEKEQHEIEIEQTIKLKHLVEEENMNLKKHNSKLKRVEKNANNKGKEDLPKNTVTRSLRRKIDVKEISFSSIESSTSDINKRKALKRVSDEDFEPSVSSKKMKSSEASKIPVKKITTRRKLQNDQGTLSPVQKLTNTISSKMKVMSNNISSQISSPRLTRGMKKLFNTEAPSSSRSGNVRREKK